MRIGKLLVPPCAQLSPTRPAFGLADYTETSGRVRYGNDAAVESDATLTRRIRAIERKTSAD